MTQEEIIQELPTHLRPFVKDQNYDMYTAQDHAVWRYVLHQLVDHLKDVAHPVYIEGLEKTGITTEYIPSIDEMNACLLKIGWKAVVVDGFIPPAIFMEFQALKILVIALDMRAFEHVLYTPAPDIVHESAGHAPFIVDVDYAEFLQKYGEIGMKAMSTKADFDIYEAIRHLSIIKEFPNTTAEEIKAAEDDLAKKIEENTVLSESSLLTRLHWWTVEYGLVGEVDDYKIFGAGLLSSLGESINCLDDTRVKKVPLTVDTINYMYDITNEQPQLFVTKSCKHLTQVLEEFSNTMCFRKGGAESIQVAIDYKTISTAEYSSGVQVSGVFTKLLKDAVGNEIYIGTTGPAQLSYQNKEILGHGIEYHKDGFGSPVGRLKDMTRAIRDYTIDELKQNNIEIGKNVVLEFLSGITVKGKLVHINRHDHKNLLFTFEECSVKDQYGNVLFDPSWGVYDMAVGDRISSVFAGSADKEKFQIYKEVAGENAIEINHSEAEKELFKLYQDIRDLREKSNFDINFIKNSYTCIKEHWPNNWLIQLELLELVNELNEIQLKVEIISNLTQLKSFSEEYDKLISLGLKRLSMNESEAIV